MGQGGHPASWHQVSTGPWETGICHWIPVDVSCGHARAPESQSLHKACSFSTQRFRPPLPPLFHLAPGHMPHCPLGEPVGHLPWNPPGPQQGNPLGDPPLTLQYPHQDSCLQRNQLEKAHRVSLASWRGGWPPTLQSRGLGQSAHKGGGCWSLFLWKHWRV